MARRGEAIEELLAAAEHARAGLPAIYREGDRPYAAADGRVVFDELARRAARGRTFLEWGSGIGTITIMAERLGFEAVGIEIDARLVAAARELAGRVGSR